MTAETKMHECTRAPMHLRRDREGFEDSCSLHWGLTSSALGIHGGAIGDELEWGPNDEKRGKKMEKSGRNVWRFRDFFVYL